ncbi:MAG: nuclear transport factor 2 family protein [Runella sp.]
MKILSFLLILFGVLQAVAQNPEKIVQQQLDAYNRQDIKAFVATYADTVEIYNFNNARPRILTKEDLAKEYGALFEKYPQNYAALHGRIIQGGYVIDKEYITGRGQEFTATAIYWVEKGLIRKVWFLR